MAYILCVDDENSLALLVRQILLMAGHEVAIAGNGPLALEMIAQREPELIVLDRSMPEMDGLEVCRRIKSNPFRSKIPVLLLTALSAIDFKIEGFEAGADDYLAKPFEPRELAARVAALLRLVAREGDRNPSSGLPGGRALGAEIERRAREAAEFAVVYVDLDHFKPFADTFGFAIADQVITATGAILGELAARENDFVGHIGGDDFLIVCPPGRAQSLAGDAAARFAAFVLSLVGPEIAARGSFTGLSREGAPREFALARLTAVVIPVEKGNWISVAHLGEAAATWKKIARAQGLGQVIVAQI